MDLNSKIYRLNPVIILGAIAYCFFSSCNGLASSNEDYAPSYATKHLSKKTLLFGVVNPAYYEKLDPLVKYLNKHLTDVQVQTVAGSNFDDYLEKLDKKYYDFTLINGMKALECEKNGYAIVGKEDNDENYRGVILVNRDSMVNHFADLKGKTIASPGKQALAGSMMPLYFLHTNGINVNKDIRISYHSSFESAMLSVYLGKSTAAMSWLANWKEFVSKRPEIESKVVIKWQTSPLMNVALLFRNDMDANIAAEIKKLFFNLQNSREGMEVLREINATKFVLANARNYQSLNEFVKKYHAAIHLD